MSILKILKNLSITLLTSDHDKEIINIPEVR